MDFNPINLYVIAWSRHKTMAHIGESSLSVGLEKHTVSKPIIEV